MASFPFSLVLILALAAPCAAAEQMINPPASNPEGSWQLAPGALLELPGGSRAVIREKLEDGSFITWDGIVILPDGHISQDEMTRKARIIAPAPSAEEARAGTENAGENKSVKDMGSPAQDQESGPPDLQAGQPEQNAPQAERQTPPTPDTAGAAPEAEKREEMQISIADLLPMTRITARGAEEKALEKTARSPAPTPAAKKTAQERAKPGKTQKGATAEEKGGKTGEKAMPGEQLRIPPGAAASGSLDFLEGCWQGIRPEYYSKRSIRECFCFDGKGNGKRRIMDSAGGGRMCIGPARASLSRNGVLSVSSGRSPCTDGERWGQAEMVCRGEGSRTPCSWVFRDARGGRQSYEIPLVRVESCGR